MSGFGSCQPQSGPSASAHLQTSVVMERRFKADAQGSSFRTRLERVAEQDLCYPDYPAGSHVASGQPCLQAGMRRRQWLVGMADSHCELGKQSLPSSVGQARHPRSVLGHRLAGGDVSLPAHQSSAKQLWVLRLPPSAFHNL